MCKEPLDNNYSMGKIDENMPFTKNNSCIMCAFCKDIKTKIRSHMASDVEKRFTLPSFGYINLSWALTKMKDQNHKCYKCMEGLDMNYSIDRITNELPHIQSNCAFACTACQQRSNRAPQMEKTKKAIIYEDEILDFQDDWIDNSFDDYIDY